MKILIMSFFNVFLLTIFAFSQQYYYRYRGSSNMTGISGNNINTLSPPSGSKMANVWWKNPNVTSYQTNTFTQSISSFQWISSPNPTSSTTTNDTYGNIYTEFTWQPETTAPITLTERFSTSTTVSIPPIPKPTDKLPLDIGLFHPARVYMLSTSEIQSDDVMIKYRAMLLSTGIIDKNVNDIVLNIAKWVRVNISYDASVSQDAVSVLSQGKGSCHGFTNLIIALLRANGIPAKYSHGIFLKKEHLMPGYGQIGTVGPGSHAFYEVYYKTLDGWISGDPQMSVNFITNHYIKRGIGPCWANCCPYYSYDYTGGKPVLSEAMSTPVTTVTPNYAIVLPNQKISDKLNYPLFGVEWFPPTGVEEPHISISSGPTEYIYPIAGATYTSNFYCPPGEVCQPPYDWNWRLEFYYNGGTYTVASVLLHGYTATWNVPAFSLPTAGYEWAKDYDGRIMGAVLLSAPVGDLNYTAAQAITYTYPFDIIFADQVVSTTRQDIIARNSITVSNVQFTGTGKINFKAGSKIDFLQNTNMYFGSIVNTIVDPGLQ